jgi:hypothetical protein
LAAHAINITDCRFDTSKFGYIDRGRFKKMITPESFSVSMERWLVQQYRHALEPGAPYSIEIFIKNFWIQGTTADELENYKVSAQPGSRVYEFLTCMATFEIYLKNGEAYVPVLRLDSLYRVAFVSKQLVETLLAKPFEDAMTAVSGIEKAKVAGAKKIMTAEELEQFNNRRLQFPRFANDPLERGIYRTFADFLNNKPTKREFTMEFGERSDEVFIMENGKSVVLTDFWGVCDGQKNYLKIGFNLFEMARQHNTYEIWGNKLPVQNYYRHTPSTADGIPGAVVAIAFNKKIEKLNKPLQLNMETGKLY